MCRDSTAPANTRCSCGSGNDVSARSYAIRWLAPGHAALIAQLEAQVHPPEHRFGEQLIHEELRATEYDGKNLSLGLYCKGKLVGMLLAFVMDERQDMADFFGVSVPPELDPRAPALYLADFAALPRHRRFAGILPARLRSVLMRREELRNLPLEMFSTNEYAEKWTAAAPKFARIGWNFQGRYTFQHADLQQTLHWLRYDPASRASEATSAEVPKATGLVEPATAWRALAKDWNEMAAAAGPKCAVPGWDYVWMSSRHLGALEEPFILAAVRDARATAIAPLQVGFASLLGSSYRVVSTIPQVPCPVLTSTKEPEAIDAIADCIVDQRASWDALELHFPAAQIDLAQLLNQRLRSRGCLVSRHAGAPRSTIALPGDIHSLRESGARAESQLSTHGALRFELATLEDTPAALERYIELELAAPEDEIGYGAALSSRHISFHRDAARHASGTGMRIGFLFVGDTVAAGLIGFQWGRHLQLTHITRAARFAEQGAARVALGLLIDRCVTQRLCDFIDISSLRPADAAGWPTWTSESILLRVHHSSFAGRLIHYASRVAGSSE